MDDRTLTADERFLRLISAGFVADVRRTLDKGYDLTFRYSAEYGWLWRTAWSTVNSVTERSVRDVVFNEERDRASIILADDILDFDFEHILEPWPRCPRHGDHSLDLRSIGGEPWWICNLDRHPEAVLGAFIEYEPT